MARPDQAAANVERYFRRDAAQLPQYGESPSPEELAARYGYAASDLIRLDANENPYGPSPRARAALGRTSLERYPEAGSNRLRRALADHAGVTPDQVVVGNGGDEVIDLVFRLFLDPGDEVINAPPSFVVYPPMIAVNRGREVDVPRLPDSYALDIEGVHRAVGSRTKVIIVCNPNNPAGVPTPREDIVELLDLGIPLLLDEAYAEFSGTSLVDLLPAYPNLLILRTLSKWSALAGLRIGYLLAAPPVIDRISAIKAFFNINAAAEAAALATLEDRDYLVANVERLREGAIALRSDLEALPFLRVVPTAGNFVTCATVAAPARDVFQALLERAIIVRLFDEPGLLRISVGTDEQNARLMVALKDVGRQFEERLASS